MMPLQMDPHPNRPFSTFVVVEPLPVRPHSKVVLHGAPRQSAVYKDSSWVVYVAARHSLVC